MLRILLGLSRSALLLAAAATVGCIYPSLKMGAGEGGPDADSGTGSADTVVGRSLGLNGLDADVVAAGSQPDVVESVADAPPTADSASESLSAGPEVRIEVAVDGRDAPHPTDSASDSPSAADSGVDLSVAPDVPLDSAGGGCSFACCQDSDCVGPCQACGAGHTCVAVAGRDDPNHRCAGTCDSTGACRSRPGQSCSTVAEGCAAGTPCVDGFCCDRACTGSCEACDVTGSPGTCTALADGAAPHPGHPPCNPASCSGASHQAAGTCSAGACSKPTVQACPKGQTCSGAACACVAPMTDCTGSCVDTQTEPSDCGACGQPCSSANGTSACTGGACGMSACSGGYLDCSTDENTSRDGCETNGNDDVNNCGKCGRVCPNDWANATPKCTLGACDHTCTAPWETCAVGGTIGCESNANTDAANCGRCGRTCSSLVCRNQTCLTTARYGNTGAGSTNVNFSGNYLAGIQVYIPNASVITGLGVVLFGSTASRNMYLGLYRDVAGNPEALLATVAAPALVSSGGKEMSVAPLPVDIPAGNYWILGVWDGSASFASNSTTPVTWRFSAYSFAALPALAPTGMNTGSYLPPNLYAIVAQ